MAGKSGQKGRKQGVQRFGLALFGVLLAGLVIVFAIAQGIGQPSVPSGDAAVVEGVPSDVGKVSAEEFKNALAQQVASGGLKKTPKEGSTKYEELKSAALGELLDTIWIQGEAEDLGVEITDKQIADELEKIKEQNFKTDAAYEKFLKESKFTQEDVDKRVKLQLLSTQIQERVTSSAAPPTNGEIAGFYEASKATQFTTKPSRDIRIIVNKDEGKVKEALTALEADNSAKSWKEVAKKFSEDPTTNSNGGEQKAITEELLATAGPLKGAIFDSATNELVGPLKFQGNYTVIEVIKLNPEKVQALGEARAQISQQLTEQLQQERFAEFVSGYQTKWESRTVCGSDFLVERCSNYKGSGHPAGAPAACYEADPKLGKGQKTLECPAPVTQTQPVIPGSVKEFLAPQGQRLVQRPRPVGLKALTPEEEAAAAAGTGLPEGAEEVPVPTGE